MSDSRNGIDEVVMSEILSKLEKGGVPKEQCMQCYDEIRFYVEARAVLLNRVPERNNQSTGYYRTYLYEVSEALGLQIELPYTPTNN